MSALTPNGDLDTAVGPTGVAEVVIGGDAAWTYDAVAINGQLLLTIDDQPETFVVRLGESTP